VPDPVRNALQELFELGRPLGEVAPPSLGLKTGANPIFLVQARLEGADTWLVKARNDQFRLESKWLRPVIKGRDVTAFSASSTGHILWPYDEAGRAVAQLPAPLLNYFRRHESVLRGRADLRNELTWALFRRKPATGLHRVVWADISRRPRAVSLEHSLDEGIPLNSCYVSNPATEEQALIVTGMLNTSWSAAIARVTADEARGGYRRLNSRVMARIPLPVGNTTETKHLIALSRQAHDGNVPNQTTLDEAAADALGLSQTARRALTALLRTPR
jgi:hypothetical protein